MEGIEIVRLHPLLREIGLDARRGILTLAGRIEYTAARRVVALDNVTLHGAVIDYRHGGKPSIDLVEAATEVVTQPEARPETIVRVGSLRVTESELGLINTDSDPEYRSFLTAVHLRVDDFSNVAGEDPGRAELRGRFMDSGQTHVLAHFQPAAAQAAFDLDLEIEDTELTTLNDLWKAYGNFDVADGRFEMYSSLQVKEGRVDGYVKPLFTHLNVYDREQDAGEGLLHQAYEGLVGAVGTLLENHPHDRVATETELLGPVENPRASAVQILLGLVRNAFFDTILPGLKGERGDR